MAPSDDIRVGDQVNVPGGMHGVVRFLGIVDGKPGRFAGIELAAEHASRGKNNGDVDGRSYFTTVVPGAGIFVPINSSKYVTKRTVITPPTPSRPSISTNFSKSVGPPSISRPRVRRPSLPRPESPRTAPPNRLNLPALRSPSSTVSKPLSAGISNGFPRTPFKTPSRLSDRPPSRVSVDDDTPTSGKFPPAFGGGPAAHELQEKVKKLEQELKDRDRQLEDQSSALAELQQSITELEGQDGASIRAQLREKNEKIAQLTAEFDSHRADFRSTLDTLEIAATETERVYEKRLDEVMQQNRELQDRGEDVEAVAMQLKQLEELVSELEEGLEDARRGEAEARGDVEFLRGEVERTRLELKQEREKSAAALKDAEGRRNTRELDQKDDEIRGLKAIIHSLSRGDVNPALLNQNGPMSPTSIAESDPKDTERVSQLEQRIQELEGLADSRSTRIEELQQQISQPQNRNSLNRNSMNGVRSRSGTVTIAPLRQMRSSHSARGSRGTSVSHVHSLSDRTVVPPDWQDSPSPDELGSPPTTTYPETNNHSEDIDRDSDQQSSEHGSLWCEICETNGHDILTCTTFGANGNHQAHDIESKPEPITSPSKPAIDTITESPTQNHHHSNGFKQPVESPVSHKTGRDAVLEGLKGIGGLTNSMGPVAGRSSGVVDESKWCALCERDGHESIDCPFDD
ncbi:putative Noc1p protein [Talaromyces proteolyticus]|uniref:Noc1p protein n=1 Tax=Talaromyces proteolyticus TaxID=1131652 RepID=A0AAD4Q0N0_9EURO|nr:putative Noc1p protein [Talaromyces proteolyticus]KAH8701014.1 putative Noc1p protein [Talaromyces proteolyticus]